MRSTRTRPSLATSSARKIPLRLAVVGTSRDYCPPLYAQCGPSGLGKQKHPQSAQQSLCCVHLVGLHAVATAGRVAAYAAFAPHTIAAINATVTLVCMVTSVPSG